MNRPIATLLFCAGLAAWAPAQNVDLAAAEQELLHVFDRPAGTPIGDEQKQRLDDFLQRHQGADLGHLGYARSLQLYLQRDYDGAVAALDAFFDGQPAIRDATHRTMAGRIYLNAVARAGREAAPDMAALSRWGERMTRLYDDTAMLERVAKAVLPRAPDPARLRVALARGVFASELGDADKDAFLQRLYGGSGDGGGRDGTAPRAGRERAAQQAAAGLQPGDLVEPFAVDTVLGGEFDLLALRGKVVVLDFFATWCPPCRGAVQGLVELQRDAGDAVQVVCVTRLYGRGMDFSGGGAVPHGGESVKGLDRDAEIAVNAAFLRAFELNYPVVITEGDVGRDRFGVSGIPTMVVIGRDGRLVGRVVGGGQRQHEELKALVATARAAQAPPDAGRRR